MLVVLLRILLFITVIYVAFRLLFPRPKMPPPAAPPQPDGNPKIIDAQYTVISEEQNQGRKKDEGNM